MSNPTFDRDREPVVGDLILCGQRYRRVTAVVDHEPGEHGWSPTRNDWPAREWVTTSGSRWSGVGPDGRAVAAPAVTSQCPGCGLVPGYVRKLADPWDTHYVCVDCGVTRPEPTSLLDRYL